MTSFGPATSSTASRSRRRQPVVHAGGDRADLGRRAVREQVLGPGRQHERDDVALADAPLREPDRDLVGDAVDVGVRQRPSRLGATYAVRSPNRRAASATVMGQHERSVHIGRDGDRRARSAAIGPRSSPGDVPRSDARAARARPQDDAQAARRGHARVRASAASTPRASTTSCAPRARRTAPSTCTSRTRKTCCARSRSSARTRWTRSPTASGRSAPDAEGYAELRSFLDAVLHDLPPLRTGHPGVDGRPRRRPRASARSACRRSPTSRPRSAGGCARPARRGDDASISALMALLERFAYFLVSRRLELDTDATLDTRHHRRAPRLLRRPASPSERRVGARLVTRSREVDRLRRAEHRDREQAADEAAGRDADERGDHRRRRRELHRAADDHRLQHVVLECSGTRGRSTRQATPMAAPWVSAEQHERHRAEEAADLRDRVRDRDPHRDQRRERDAERERRDEHHDAGERGDEHRARDVAADRRCRRGAPKRSASRSSALGNEPPRAR